MIVHFSATQHQYIFFPWFYGVTTIYMCVCVCVCVLLNTTSPYQGTSAWFDPLVALVPSAPHFIRVLSVYYTRSSSATISMLLFNSR